MNSGLLGGLAAVGAVVVVALLMRGRGSADPMAMPPRPAPESDAAPEPEPPATDDDDGDGVDDGLVVAVTSDGHAVVPDRHAVRLLPPEESGEEWKVGAGIKSSTLRAERALSMSWQSGDLRGVRVVRGAADEGPWRLEALGRDGEYVPFVFETDEAAEAAKVVFERLGIVRLGEDDDGRPMPPSPEQFEEARRVFLETEAELGLDLDEEQP
jgi:hypothetical protein